MRPNRLAQTADTYAKALDTTPQGPPIARFLRQDFVRIACGLARYGFVERQQLLEGEAGQELLHETVGRLLGGSDVDSATPSELIRLVGRIAYAIFRREKRWWGDFPQSPLRAPETGKCDAEAPQGQFARLIDDLLEEDCQKRCGGVHLGRLSERHGLSRRSLSRRLTDLTRSLGMDEDSDRFWRARLGECLVDMLHRRLTHEVPDLLDERRRRDARRRMRSLLGRLRHLDRSDAALEEVRQMERVGRFPTPALVSVALVFSPDPVPVRLAEAERLRARGDSDAALATLATLDTIERRSGAGPLPVPRQRLLVGLARSRCLESAGCYREASDLLEPLASVRRRDPLLAFDRLVLAEAAGYRDRVAEARRDLARLAAATVDMHPLLRLCIRDRL